MLFGKDKRTDLDRWIDACASGNVVQIELMLDGAIDVNARNPNDGKCGIHCAVDNGHVAAVQCLLRRGANPNVQDQFGQSPLIYAVDLVEHEPDGFDPNYPSAESIALVAILLFAGGDPHLRDLSGQSALAMAKELGYAIGVEMMESFAREASRERKD